MRMRSICPKDRSGSAALEFAFIAWPFFFLIFAMFDLAHYMAAQNELNTLASEVARAMIVSCGSANTTNPGQMTSSCRNPLSSTQYEQIAPLLYIGTWTPTVSLASGVGSNSITVTASLNGFDTLVPWGSILGSLSASTTVHY